MNRNKSSNVRADPGENHRSSLSPVTYKVDEIDERFKLSNKKKPIAYKISKVSDNQLAVNSLRFIDIAKKNKDWVPAANQYVYTAEQLRKNTSSSPLLAKHKR